MPRDMFGGVDPVRKSTGQRFTVPLSILAHALVLFALVVVPLVATGALPTPLTVITFVATPPPPPAPPPPPPPPAPAMAPPPTPIAVNADAAPIVAPKEITPEPPRPLVAQPRGLEGGLPNTTSGHVLAPPPPPERSKPLPIGGLIQPPQKLLHVAPVYPLAAKAAKLEGMVIVQAIIGTDGRIKDARVLRGHPLLNQAALDAVGQWRFSPTLLNTEAVEVVMSVTVNFQLQ
jgi:protein TonB